MELNWDDLRVFLAVVRTGRMNLASRQLNMDATTVGRRIARLEATLGARLFEQGSTGWLATEQGQRLADHAEAMEHSALLARSDAGQSVGGLTGSVRLSVSEGFGAWILPRHLPEFHHKHPGLTIDVVASGGFLSPSKREADVAIMLARPAKGPLLVRKLTDYSLCFYASPTYLDRFGAPTSIDDLRAHVLISYIPDLVHVPQQRLLEEASPALQATARSSSINAQTALVAAGGGIGVLPCFIGDQVDGVTPVLTDKFVLRRPFWMIVHKDIRHLKRIDEIVGWLDCIARNDHNLFTGSRALSAAPI